MQTEQLSYTRAAGGRVNLRTAVDGLLEVDAEPAAQDRTRDEYLPPTETRLVKLGAGIVVAEATLSGAPVEPGNLLALAYLGNTPVLCAPGCAKGLKRNVVDLLLPRLLLGDRLDRRDVAALGLGGFLTAAERGSDSG